MKREIHGIRVSIIIVLGLLSISKMNTYSADTETKTPLTKEAAHVLEIEAKAADMKAWDGKALANTESKILVVKDSKEKSEISGEIYSNTIVTVEEEVGEWAKIQTGHLIGYVKKTDLLFGLEAAERAKIVCLRIAILAERNNLEKTATTTRITREGKTVEEIAAEIEAARVATEAEKTRVAMEAALVEQQEKEAERYLLAAIIHCEANGEPYEGQVAVGAVILNRVASPIFPNTIAEVIYQKSQFGPVITGKIDRVLESGEINESCYQAADDALAGINPIGEALYFGNGDYGKQIGNHWFH